MKIREYEEDFGTVSYPSGFEQMLEGLSIEEQMKYFRIGNGLYKMKPLAERVRERGSFSCRLEECSEVREIVVREGKIVGAVVHDSEFGCRIVCLAEQNFCCSFGTETDGSGEKRFAPRLTLLCVPEHFD